MATVKTLVVAWGGWGWRLSWWGGGAGGYQYNPALIITHWAYTVTVGNWWVWATTSSNWTNGSNSIFSSITAIGGWGGGTDNQAGSIWWCGWGGTQANLWGTGSQWWNGWSWRIGSWWSLSWNPYSPWWWGGANANWWNGIITQWGNGWNGILNDISGADVVYAGGGGGGSDSFRLPASQGTGGDGGGGAGANSTILATAGTNWLGWWWGWW